LSSLVVWIHRLEPGFLCDGILQFQGVNMPPLTRCLLLAPRAVFFEVLFTHVRWQYLAIFNNRFALMSRAASAPQVTAYGRLSDTV
jgi:hypothetical protein